MTHHRLLILGSGPAGYTAAIYAGRANLAPGLISGLQPGGQLTTTTDVDNWPGEAEGIQGPDLMEKMRQQAARFNSSIIADHIVQAELKPGDLRLYGEREEYRCDAVIIATGASARYLGLPSEEHYKGRGVSACATCDGFFHRDREVAVIGGGNSAVEEALYLSRIASKVTLIHRRDQLRAERILQDQLMAAVAAGRIAPLWWHELDTVLGDESGVTGILARDKRNDRVQQLALSGVFIAIGHDPNTGLFKGQLKMDESGYLITRGGRQQTTACSVAGVFAAGDVSDPYYRQAVTSAGSGCMAALDAEQFLANA